MGTLKKALITGGAGFIGSHIADAFLQNGYEVWAIDNLSTGKKENLNYKVKLFVEDICLTEFSDLFNEFKPSVVIHCAAQISVSKSMEDPSYDIDNNVKGSIRLLEGLKSAGMTKDVYLVFLSTGGAMYGETATLPATEECPTSPLSVYGCSKRAVEIYLNMWNKVYNLEYSSLRLSNVYGPRQDPHGEAGVVAIFSLKLLSGEAPTIYGDGNQTRDFIYVEDVVKAVISASEKRLCGIFNVGTGKETSVNELYKFLSGCAGNELSPRYAPPRSGELKRSSISCAKLNKLCGFVPKVELKEGLAKTYSWFKSNSCS